MQCSLFNSLSDSGSLVSLIMNLVITLASTGESRIILRIKSEKSLLLYKVIFKDSGNKDGLGGGGVHYSAYHSRLGIH